MKIPDLRTINTLHSEKLLGKSFLVKREGKMKKNEKERKERKKER